MSDKLELLQILFQKRNARKRGPTSSDQFNDMIDELAHDLATLSDQWNNRLVPLNNTLPTGTYSAPSAATITEPDAFTDGLDGKTLFTDSRATSGTYFDTTNSRPTTVHQQFEDVYVVISNVKSDLENLITSNIPAADQIAIEDTGGLFIAGNVETALAEVKAIADAINAGSGDVTKVGTPVDNELGVWTGDGTIEGDTKLTWSGTELTVQGDVSVASSTGNANGEDFLIKTFVTELTLPAGPTGTVLTLPDNSLVLACNGYVTTTITTDDADTGINIGLLGALGTEFGASIGLTAGSTFSMTDGSGSFPENVPVSDDIVIVGDVGGDFTAGAVRVVVYYMELKALTS